MLWQPQYILTKYMSVCGVGMTSVTASVVLSSVARGQSQTYGRWCVAQFCILRCFFLTSQMTLALMAAERYVFICHGIHYLRMIKTHNVHLSMALVWLISGAASVHGGLVLTRFKCGLQLPTSGLLCDAFTIKEHVSFSWEEGLLIFGPPSVLTIFCILAICYCYGCMYHAALKVSTALKCNNHRANRTVGYYLLMFTLQLALNISFVVLTLVDNRKISSCRNITFMVSPMLIILPLGINATFLLIRNPQIKRLFFSAFLHSGVAAEVEMFERSRVADDTEDQICHHEDRREVEVENSEDSPFPLPGYVCPASVDHS